MDTPIVPSKIRKVFEGRVFSVQIESITLPKGHALDAEIVRHPGSVVIVPMNGSNEIALVRQYRHPVGRNTWEIPAGSLKPGEDPRAAARRECQEEVGLVADRLEPLGSFFPTPGYCNEEMHFFLATALRPPREGDEEAHQDEDEDIETRWMALDELRGMIRRNEIVDLKTIAGVALVSAS
ncbi:MAG TPA: NUDIX hydrolase [Vicinamibacterales bacterium]|jgi:ADP-ribose pyrophosphatase|nr:NUDIX hydrolase [Vicinamibacterales bacterium]